MKHFTRLLLTLMALAIILTGCGTATPSNPNMLQTTPAATTSTTEIATTVPSLPQTTAPSQPTTVPEQVPDNDTEPDHITRYNVSFDARIIKYQYIGDTIQWPLVIKSAADLKKLPEYGSEHYIFDYIHILENYNASFFANHTLIAVCLYTQPGTRFAAYQAEDICKLEDGSYEISLNPFHNTAIITKESPSYDVLLIEVKADIPQDAIFHFTVAEGCGQLVGATEAAA